ncbi:helix-turn-helix DNA binding domain protein [Mycobacterium phage BabyRay]|uniref:Helix-turn-helix DNA binding domain protein n=1 Tax=Mycobacterium phage BabyRay TaxID=1897486 RepID=A0A1D8EW35_9CAUD|nr:helix-turn-helix DNA binding domain protein [Mycobacterium phage BabyRay]AOT25424.1 helix-turn-helix DNA binding domain protein [Mycobacterium phage BabyRay]
MIRKLFSLVGYLTSHIGDIVTNRPGPNNPRDWDPNHPSLKSPLAPHETGAVLRAQRAGFSGQWITKNFGLRPSTLMTQMRKEMDYETKAHTQGRPIYDGQTSKRIIPVRNLDEERRRKEGGK